MFYETANGHGLPHDPFKAIVAPRPIGWISSRSHSGAVNLAPYSFFNALTTSPYLVWFSSEGAKDSVAFAEETGEFVANLVSRDLVEQMNKSSVDAPRGVNEFDYAGLTEAPSRLVNVPRVAEAHAALECKVTELFRPRDLQGRPSAAHVVIGQVVGIHIADDFLENGLFDITKAQTTARLGYMDYAAVTETFPLRRPRWTD
ncbi:flavin reductase family protein [Tianweitania sediminis]|uniref:Flavin reductase family protein n=1 Tax=Tianweitania sediminis TaxID=1502156 RepID=A0A8J7R1T3_9HYPH|nr:flavin reductase family protein [Tianweitania sediminis]MBP0439862.1 flavin reductase family protein [Tianweitania sediminis]